MQKKVMIVGATSGIGREVAMRYIRDGHVVGVMGRRMDLLESLRSEAPSRVFCRVVDVNAEDADVHLRALVDEMGGMDVYLHSSGIGFQNVALERDKELRTVETNCLGFTRMITAAFHYFSAVGQGHIAAISSIAGTRGLGAAPAYSASKRFQSHYLQSLAQLVRIRRLKIKITDLRPGFVDTDMLGGGRYPMLMRKSVVADAVYKAVCSQRRVKIIDWRYAVLVFLWRLLPRFVWEHWRVVKS